MDDIDAEVLITLVEARPVLWDKSLDVYKDKIATKNGWREVCFAIKEDFDLMEEKVKNAFGKEVIRRWTNLRDSFVKSNIKIQAAKKSGSAAKKIKKYVYSDQLQFLKKNYVARETEDSFQSESTTELHEDTGTQSPTENIENASQPFNTPSTQVTPKSVSQTKTRKHRKPDEVEMRIIKALEADKPCRKMSFLLSLKPHLDKFDEQDYLQFQLGVLKVIEEINRPKKTISSQQPPSCDQQTRFMPYNQCHAFSRSPRETMSSYHTLHSHPAPLTPNPGFSHPPGGSYQPNGFGQVQTLRNYNPYQQGIEVSPPQLSPSNGDSLPPVTQLYQKFGENLASQDDSLTRHSLSSNPDSFDFSSS